MIHLYSFHFFRTLRRSHTYSTLGVHHLKLLRESTRLSSPITRILEKRESLLNDEDNVENFEDDIREKSIQKLRGILKKNLNAGAVVRKIQFSMESQDQLGKHKQFDKLTKRQFNSPPPKMKYNAGQYGEFFVLIMEKNL